MTKSLTSALLCLTLHYIFIRYASTVVGQNGYRLSRALCLFFDFLVEYNSKNPVQLHPTQFTEITTEILIGYQDYLRRAGEPISNAEKLKSALGNVAKQHGTIPLLLFPIIDRAKPKKTEPLYEDAYSSLSTALMQHIDTLYEKLEFRKAVADAQPYDFDSLDSTSRPAKIRLWNPEHTRSFKTLLNSGFPMSMTMDELEGLLSIKNISSYRRDCDTTLKVITHKYVKVADYNNAASMDDLLSAYYPRAMDQSAIVLFLLLQSGWNKETAIQLDPNDFVHALTGSINEGLAVVFSEKNRSQGTGLPYDAPKQITASSDRSDRYSIINLILLARDLSEPLKDFEFDNNPFQQYGEERSELYLCMRAWGDWFKNGSRHTSISVLRAYVIGVEHFLKKYEVVENGKRLTRAGELTTRLRPTWALHKKRSTSLGIISAHFGHVDRSTTDIHYDSSGAAMQERRQRLRDELDEVVKLLVSRQFSGLLGKRTNDQASASVRIFTLPGKDRPLWGCEDQLNPDWLGHESFIKPGRKCYQLEKCLGCSRVRIYEDSLPYLMERLAHIEYELETESDGPRTSDLEWERQVLEYLINDCHDDEMVKQAARYRRRNAPLLPRDISSLRLIFEEDSSDV
ncbi:hypothetical protein [Pseudomonas viridiflava]|uniref:hypothetical protein n=1 Tax=Pseudomonas viridiflava TaxID=33069 RepID=UPI002A6A2865|nr:hypothetical protein [Pseudomonas viridiflava]MDY0937615.1 hypothetical protein [Pseudomonas viridiflava]MDY1014843.1 hypothetical protein [Pseudomonas viridiflava]